jgi:prepilin-type N-terminal cleavage/methylation domain-containing protein
MLDSQVKRGPLALRRGFSLLEVVVVMTIMTLLATLLFPVVGRAVARARQTECRSNLRQFASALMIYRSEHRGRNPGWLSSLYPDYVDSRELYLCPSDKSRGEDGGKPDSDDQVLNGAFGSDSQFEETDDNYLNSERIELGANADVERCSYLYEFNAAECSWANTNSSWGAVKLDQLENGDDNNDHAPYSESRMPIIRCFHHWNEGRVPAVKENGQVMSEPITINVGYAGNVFVAPLMWEERQDMTER